MTTGWGNMIPRRGGHFSVPVEIGAAFVGTPALNMALTSGQVCQDPAGTIGCMNVVGNSQIQSNLAAQQAKYQNDLNPLKIYPIFTTGIAYSFTLRGGTGEPGSSPTIVSLSHQKLSAPGPLLFGTGDGNATYPSSSPTIPGAAFSAASICA